MLNTDLIVGFGSLILAAIAFLATRNLSMLGGVFVNFTLWAVLIISLLEIIKGFVKPERTKFFESKNERNNIIVGISILGCYLILLPLIGFLISSLFSFVVLNLYLSQQKITLKEIVKSVLLAFVVVATFYLVFHYVLEVPLPKGRIFCN